MAVTNYRPRPLVRGRIRQNVTLKSDDPVVRTARLVQKGTGNFAIVYSEPRGGKGTGWRSRTLSTRTSDPAQAQREFQRFIDDAIEKSQPITPQDQLTIETLCQEYILHQPRQEGALRSIRKHLGHVRVVDLTPDILRRYVAAMGNPLANTQRRYLSALKAALNHGRKSGTLKIVPPYVPMPSVGPARTRWLTREQLTMVWEKVCENEANHPGPRTHALKVFVFLASTFGARREAIRELTWDRVHWDTHVVDFKNPAREPNKKRRATVRMPDEAYRFLREVWLQAGCPAAGKVIQVGFNALDYAYQNFFQSIGLGWCTSHVFRHTLATHLLQAGESVYKVALILADSVKTIETTYAHVPPADLQQVLENRKLGWA